VVQTGRTAGEAQAIINEYLQAEGLTYIEERGERMWRKGVGWLAAPQFIKAEPAEDGSVRIEAWTAGFAFLPGVYAGEMDPMQGVWGAAPKMALKARIRELERRLATAATPAVPMVPAT
jgi:hypothetical protein